MQLPRTLLALCALGIIGLNGAAAQLGGAPEGLRKAGQGTLRATETDWSERAADATDCQDGCSEMPSLGGRAGGIKCALNEATGANRCAEYAVDAAQPIELGSANGLFAFLLNEDKMRIVMAEDGGSRTRWRNSQGVEMPALCEDRLDATFSIDGQIVLSCDGLEIGSLVVNDPTGRKVAKLTMDDAGVVRFRDAEGKTIVAIYPSIGPLPRNVIEIKNVENLEPTATIDELSGTATLIASYTIELETQSATPTASAETTEVELTRTTPRYTRTLDPATPAYPMVTPSLNAKNRILDPECRYLPVPFPLPEGKTADNIFNIELISCNSTAEADDVFVAAAQRWMSIISADLPSYVSEEGVDCVLTTDSKPILNCGSVDDLIIAFSVGPIDGPGKAVGSGAPIFTRGADWPVGKNTPISGWMQFDSADFADLLAKGLAPAVVAHEMGHALGIGTLWPLHNLITPADCNALAQAQQPIDSATFIGPNAASTLPLLGLTASSAVPIQKTGTMGTACMHWDEDIFGTELMTGYVSEAANPLSVLTAKSLEDMGYTVDTTSSAIEKFTVSTGQQARERGAGVQMVGCTDGFKGARPVPFAR